MSNLINANNSELNIQPMQNYVDYKSSCLLRDRISKTNNSKLNRYIRHTFSTTHLSLVDTSIISVYNYQRIKNQNMTININPFSAIIPTHYTELSEKKNLNVKIHCDTKVSIHMLRENINIIDRCRFFC